MSELRLKVPSDVKLEFERSLGSRVSYEMWQLLFSRFLREQLKVKLDRIKRLESIVSKSKLTERQAKKLADEASLSVARRFLSSAGVKYPK